MHISFAITINFVVDKLHVEIAEKVIENDKRRGIKECTEIVDDQIQYQPAALAREGRAMVRNIT